MIQPLQLLQNVMLLMHQSKVGQTVVRGVMRRKGKGDGIGGRDRIELAALCPSCSSFSSVLYDSYLVRIILVFILRRLCMMVMMRMNSQCAMRRASRSSPSPSCPRRRFILSHRNGQSHPRFVSRRCNWGHIRPIVRRSARIAIGTTGSKSRRVRQGVHQQGGGRERTNRSGRRVSLLCRRRRRERG